MERTSEENMPPLYLIQTIPNKCRRLGLTPAKKGYEHLKQA